jgi:hypothetical protein
LWRTAQLPMTQPRHMFWHLLGNLAPIDPANIPVGSSYRPGRPRSGVAGPMSQGKRVQLWHWTAHHQGIGLPRCFLCMFRGIRSMAAGKSWPVVAGSIKLVVVGRCSKPRLFTSGKLRRSDVVAAIARVTQPAQIQSCLCPHPPSLPHKPL